MLMTVGMLALSAVVILIADLGIKTHRVLEL
jgi:hypothetical protein